MGTANWAGNLVYRADTVQRPRTVDELREIVTRAPRVRVLGSRHCFNEIADSEELVSLDALPPDIAVDGRTVSFSAGLRYGELAEALNEHGLALHNLASLPHISVAGAVATATHGSGEHNGNLATAVAALELVTSTGEIVRAARGEADFDGMVVGLGALGAVTRLTLDVEPAYDVRQRVFEDLAWDALLEHFDAIAAAGYSVSVFTRWADSAGHVWVKQRVEEDDPDELFGARPATVEHHPVPGVDPVHCTAQLGVPGRWSDRLPHFRMGFTPSVGEELQSELHVPRAHASAAIEAVRALGATLRPVLRVCELRTIAADRLWLSPQYERDTLAMHFTWIKEPEPVGRALLALEDALSSLGPRPHWGKLFAARDVGARYERAGDFARLCARLDPRGAFRNEWLEAQALAPP